MKSRVMCGSHSELSKLRRHNVCDLTVVQIVVHLFVGPLSHSYGHPLERVGQIDPVEGEEGRLHCQVGHHRDGGADHQIDDELAEHDVVAERQGLTNVGIADPNDQKVHQVDHETEFAHRHEEVPREERVYGSSVARSAAEDDPRYADRPSGPVQTRVEGARNGSPYLSPV